MMLVSLSMFCCDISCCLYHFSCFVVISAACIIVHVLSWCQLLPVSLSTFCCDISCRLYHCPCFVVISAAACIIVHVLLWYQLPLVSLSMFCCDIGCRLHHCPCRCLYHCPCFIAISATACIIVHVLLWYQLPLVPLSMFLRYRLLLVSLSMLCRDISCRLYHCPCFVAISVTACIIVHGPLVRSVKIRVTHTPGMSGTSSPPLRVSDPGLHHGTCVAAIWQEAHGLFVR